MNKPAFVRSLLLMLFLSIGTSIFAQKFGFPKVEERQLIGTRWRYTYALHVESNTTIHQSDQTYQYFLHLQYDFTFEQYLNNRLTKGNWSLNGSTLFYPFRNIKKFDIAEIDNHHLVLEFQQPNANGTYQYHFVAVEANQTPFVRPANELEEVIVEGYPNKEKKGNWWSFFKKKEKTATADNKNKSKETPNNNLPPLSIELIGGGYYGGIDPVIKDFISIRPDGRLIQEFQSVNQPLHVVKKNIPRAELEQFAQYVMDNHFFDAQRIYDCSSPACEKRKLQKPTPIPLRLMISYGERKKVVTIVIWGQDQAKQRYVDYPPAFDNIIDAIQRFAHRIESREKAVGTTR